MALHAEISTLISEGKTKKTPPSLLTKAKAHQLFEESFLAARLETQFKLKMIFSSVSKTVPSVGISINWMIVCLQC